MERLQVEGYKPAPDAISGNTPDYDVGRLPGVVRGVGGVDVTVLGAGVGRGLLRVGAEDCGVSGYGAARA